MGTAIFYCFLVGISGANFDNRRFTCPDCDALENNAFAYDNRRHRLSAQVSRRIRYMEQSKFQPIYVVNTEWDENADSQYRHCLVVQPSLIPSPSLDAINPLTIGNGLFFINTTGTEIKLRPGTVLYTYGGRTLWVYSHDSPPADVEYVLECEIAGVWVNVQAGTPTDVGQIVQHQWHANCSFEGTGAMSVTKGLIVPPYGQVELTTNYGAAYWVWKLFDIELTDDISEPKQDILIDAIRVVLPDAKDLPKQLSHHKQARESYWTDPAAYKSNLRSRILN